MSDRLAVRIRGLKSQRSLIVRAMDNVGWQDAGRDYTRRSFEALAEIHADLQRELTFLEEPDADQGELFDGV